MLLILFTAKCAKAAKKTIKNLRVLSMLRGQFIYEVHNTHNPIPIIASIKTMLRKRTMLRPRGFTM